MKDPRKAPDFEPRLYPSCDGAPFTLCARGDRWRPLKARFLAAFYQINLHYARLQAVRRGHPARAQAKAERPILQALEKAILDKEALEDRYASKGFVAEPLYLDGAIINVRFRHPGARVTPGLSAAPIRSSASSSIALALPPASRRRCRTM